jgi:signal transduction histidine kinase/CheY-like chemotaxis protein
MLNLKKIDTLMLGKSVYKDLPVDYAHSIRMMNVAYMCMFLVYIFYFVTGASQGIPIIIIESLSLIIISLIGYFILAPKRYYTLAKSILVGCISCGLFLNYNCYNVSNTYLTLYFPVFFAFTSVFDFKRERKAILIHIFVLLASFLANFLMPRHLFTIITLPADLQVFFDNYLHYFLSVSVTVFFVLGTGQVQYKLRELLNEAKDDAIMASKAKSDFLSSMSHELRTPLNGIIGTTNLMLDETNPKQNRNYLKTLKYTADHMLQLINQVLEFSKAEAKMISLEKANFNLSVAMRRVCNNFVNQSISSDVAFTYYIDEKISANIKSDEFRLAQVLFNLLSNAFKFTENGSVKLSAQAKNITEQNITVEFSVKDTGIGIDEKNLKSIFESFTQAESGTTRKYGGTGLGLSISNEIVQKFGSSLKVESVLDEGSTFSFTVTFEKGEDLRGIRISNTEAQLTLLKDKNILIAEDNPVNMMVAKLMLQKWGANVTEARNGQEAINEASDNIFDLILLDLEMPVVDGKTALKEILKFNNVPPILAFTASLYDNMEADLKSHGFTSHILKPFKPAELFSKLQGTLHKN